MTTRYLSNRIADSTGLNPAPRLPMAASVLPVPFKITLAATASGDVVPAVHIPEYCRLVDLKVKNAALGASVTLVWGDSADPDRYIKSYSGAAAAIKNGFDNEAAAFVDPSATATTLDLTIGGAAATGVIEGIAFLARD